MRKHLIMALVALMPLAIISCGGDDDDVPPAQEQTSQQLLARLQTNQMGIAGRPYYDLNDVFLDVTAPYTEWDGMQNSGIYHFTLFSEVNPNYHVDLIFDITPDMVGKTIDISNLRTLSEGARIGLTCTIAEAYPGDDVEQTQNFQFVAHMNMYIYKNEMTCNEYQYQKEGQEGKGSIKEGKLYTAKTAEGVKVEITGTLSSGHAFAYKGFVPNSEIRYSQN